MARVSQTARRERAAWEAAGLGARVRRSSCGRLCPRQARELAEQLRADGRAPDDALRALLDDRASLLANAASAIAMLVVLWLMVAKP